MPHSAITILVDGALYIVEGARLHRFDLTMRIATPIAGAGGTISPGDASSCEAATQHDTIRDNGRRNPRTDAKHIAIRPSQRQLAGSPSSTVIS